VTEVATLSEKKDFLAIDQWSAAELRAVLDLAKQQKPLARRHELPHTLPNRVLACVFAKPSLGTRESVHDVAKVMSRFCDGIMIRWFDDDEVQQLARHATVPVVNGLTDLTHPCQVMADILTIEGRTVVMVGDGNNLANSWLNASIRFPFNFILACPEGYEPDEGIMNKAEAAGASFMITHDPKEAVEGAHVIYSDAFYSMGQEDEAVQRRKDFAPFQITTGLLAGADPGHIVLHCLPAHRGEEITDEVMDGPHAVVFDEAENRLHAQRAILATLIR